MAVPAGAIVVGEVAHLLLSPALILGWGPFPELGIAGAGIGVLAAYGIGSVILIGYLLAGRALLRPGWRDLLPRLEAIATAQPNGSSGSSSYEQIS